MPTHHTRRRQRRHGRWLPALACAVLALVLTGPPPAQAASYGYGMSSTVPGYKGGGMSQGTISYGSNKTKVGIHYTTFDDLCPEDGLAVQLRLRSRSAGGSATDWGVMTDYRGCAFNPYGIYSPITFTAPWNIAESRAELWATEGGAVFWRFDTTAWKAYAP